MLINLTDYGSWYIDILQKRQIIVNATTNSSFGCIKYDENDNRICITDLDCGRKDIVSMTANTNGNLIITNEDRDYYTYVDQIFTESDDEYKYMLDMYVRNQVYVNSNREEIINIASGNIYLDLTDRTIFKVILNDTEIKNYTSNDSSITPTGDDADYFKTYNNRAIVYTYATDQTVSGETIFEYYAPEKFFSYEENDYVDGTFFEDMISFCDFDEFNIRQNETLGGVTSAYRLNERQRNLNRLVEVSVAYRGDKRKEIGNNYFRLVGWSEEYRKLSIINNCLNQTGADKSFVINGANTTTQTYTADNYIEVDYIHTEGLLGYGLDPYGNDEYGSFNAKVTNFSNLSRKEVNS